MRFVATGAAPFLTILVLCVPAAASVTLEEPAPPAPIMPIDRATIALHGWVRCTPSDFEAGTATTIRFSELYAPDWDVFVDPSEIVAYLDAARCADPSYAVPFSTEIRASPTLHALAFEPTKVLLHAMVTKQPPGQQPFREADARTMVTLRADHLVNVRYYGGTAREWTVQAGSTVPLWVAIMNDGNGPVNVSFSIRSADPDIAQYIELPPPFTLGTHANRSSAAKTSTLGVSDSAKQPQFHVPGVARDEYVFSIDLTATPADIRATGADPMTYQFRILVEEAEPAYLPSAGIAWSLVLLFVLAVASARRSSR